MNTVIRTLRVRSHPEVSEEEIKQMLATRLIVLGSTPLPESFRKELIDYKDYGYCMVGIEK